MSGSIHRSVLMLTLAAALAISGEGQQSKLGKVEFPTTGSPAAQVHFIRGVAALHSFWYEEALDEFRQSTRIDPDFTMGYWGEAMAYNHPLWSEQDTEAARQVLTKTKESPKLTARERAYLNAVKVLYGDGEKHARDLAYAGAMEKIYRDYPADTEAACFYALSLLGTIGRDDKGFRRQAKAGAIALDVYQKNPDHPGAAHYIIHAFDDPEHAILALPAARRYAEIAPQAPHALHMPSHIFLQLGMWPEAAASNEASWAASDAWVKRKNLSLSMRDYHSLYWLQYIYLQQGRYDEAEKLLAIMREAMTQSKDENKLRPHYLEMQYVNMAATFIVETERWELSAKLFNEYDQMANVQSSTGGMAGHGGPLMSRTTPNNIQALRVAAGGSPAAAKAAVEKEKQAVAEEEELGPPSGPPRYIKPAHELLGEILLQVGRSREAGEFFATSLVRQPNRARSLLGAARAAAQSNDPKNARAFYSTFLQQWQKADPQLPELREAHDYLKQSSGP